MTSQQKKDNLTVSTDETGRPYILVDPSRAEALRAYLSENGFSSTHVEEEECDLLKLGNADPRKSRNCSMNGPDESTLRMYRPATISSGTWPRDRATFPRSPPPARCRIDEYEPQSWPRRFLPARIDRQWGQPVPGRQLIEDLFRFDRR